MKRSSQRRGFLSWQSDATHKRRWVDAKGYVPRPPMPPLRMTQEDAAAVVAYLKSLP